MKFSFIYKHKVLHYLAILASVFYDSILLKFDGKIFCLLFNMKSKLRSWDVKFNYDSETKKYFAVSKKYTREFYHEKIANGSYHGGFATRAKSLASAYLLHHIEFNDNDVVIDCGANVGDFALHFFENNINVNYFAIEPSPSEYACLVNNVKPFQALNIGLWYENGEIEFYVSSKGADSSFIQPPKYDSIVKIPTRRLDSIVTNGKIKLLKIEAEGAEPEVIQGCLNALDRIEYITADLGYERGIEQSSTLVPVINTLLTNNFELIDISTERYIALFRNRKFV